MLDLQRNSSADMDATLERLRKEVVSLSTNLETLANRPEMPLTKTQIDADDRAELITRLF